MNIEKLYQEEIRRADGLIQQLGVREELVQNDTMCLQVPTNAEYARVREQLDGHHHLISESLVNGRLIAVFELTTPISEHGWSLSYIELPQPKTANLPSGVRHLQFVTRTGIESFRSKFPALGFEDKGNTPNRILEVTAGRSAVRFHDKSMGAVIEIERCDLRR